MLYTSRCELSSETFEAKVVGCRTQDDTSLECRTETLCVMFAALTTSHMSPPTRPDHLDEWHHATSMDVNSSTNAIAPRQRSSSCVAARRTQCLSCGGGWCPGRAVQANPIKRRMEAAGTKRLKRKCHKLLSNVAFKFNLSRYAPGAAAAPQQSAVQPCGGRDSWILLATACGVMQLSDEGSKRFG
jgi:hypothetical protein